MKKSISFLIVLMLFCSSRLMAQSCTAAEYWRLENENFYLNLQQKKDAGNVLSSEEVIILDEHKKKLDAYFQKLSDNEKSLYYKNRALWSANHGADDINLKEQEDEVFSGDRSSFSKYLFTSGLFGFAYGGAAVAIVEASGGGAVGIPLLTAGASTLVPIISIKDKYVSYNSLSLSLHGKTLGWLHGAALGLLLTGDNNEDGYKLVLGLATLSSIGAGHVGYALGRDKEWSKGRVALYSHYGILMPLEGLAIDAAFHIDNPRVYAATFMAFGAGGYLIADKVADWNDFTVGDVTSIQTLTALQTMLGIGVMTEFIDSGPELLLIPAIGALGGTITGQFLLKNTRLSNQQGRNTALAATGGAVIGLGLAAIINSESSAPYYMLPYVAGMGAYGLVLNSYKKSSTMPAINSMSENRWNINIMPQNILLNQKLEGLISMNPGKRISYLPAFSASVMF